MAHSAQEIASVSWGCSRTSTKYEEYFQSYLITWYRRLYLITYTWERWLVGICVYYYTDIIGRYKPSYRRCLTNLLIIHFWKGASRGIFRQLTRAFRFVSRRNDSNSSRLVVYTLEWKVVIGSTVGRLITSNTRDLQFESSHRQCS